MKSETIALQEYAPLKKREFVEKYYKSKGYESERCWVFSTIAATFRCIYGYEQPFYAVSSGWLKLELLKPYEAQAETMSTISRDKDASSVKFGVSLPIDNLCPTGLGKERADEIKRKIKKLLKCLNILEIENLAHHFYFSRRKNGFYPADLFIYNPRTKENFFVLIHPHTTAISEEKILAAQNLEKTGHEVKLVKVDAKKILRTRTKPKSKLLKITAPISPKEDFEKLVKSAEYAKKRLKQLFTATYKISSGTFGKRLNKIREPFRKIHKETYYYVSVKDYEKAKKLIYLLCQFDDLQTTYMKNFNYSNYTWLGNIARLQGNYEEAIYCYKAAKKIILAKIISNKKTVENIKDFYPQAAENARIRKLEYGDEYYFEKKEIEKLEELIKKCKGQIKNKLT